MSKKSLIFILALILAGGGGIFIWRVSEARAKDAKIESEILKKLTAEDINLVLDSGADSGAAEINQTADARRVFLKGMREYLALAAAARREGMAEDENFKINFEYKKNLLLADLYRAKLTAEQKSFYTVPQAEIDAVWTDPECEKQFETDMSALQTIQAAVAKERGENYSISKLQGGSLIKARENWARAKILSDKAKADAEFMSKPEIALRTKILEAGILSADYLRKHWAKNVRATSAEIAVYLAAHPEYDVRRKHEQAEAILRRAQAGEDFSRLAKEFSEDRTTKDKGGLHENIEKNMLWAEVERAALALEKDRIAERLIETEIGWHIVKLENKQINKDGEAVKYSVRHILLQKNFAEPNGNPEIPAPFLRADEIAKSAVEKEKRARFVERVGQLNEISLPTDFTFSSPANAAVADNSKSN